MTLAHDTSAEVWVPLTQEQVTVIDFDDFEKVRDIKWCASKTGKKFYAKRGSGGRKNQKGIYLHHVILPAKAELEVDHIDGDSLNNRRNNLRLVTRLQNTLNKKLGLNKSSKYRGVSLHSDGRKRPWKAVISIKDKSVFLGNFLSEKEAARAFDRVAIKLRGSDAKLNFPSNKKI